MECALSTNIMHTNRNNVEDTLIRRAHFICLYYVFMSSEHTTETNNLTQPN